VERRRTGNSASGVVFHSAVIAYLVAAGHVAPGQVLAIGSNAVTLPFSYGRVSIKVPALHLKSWNFTGGASG